MAPFRPQLRTLLLLMNVLVLLLPIGGITLLKMYENELVRQTESALIGQAALLSTLYAKALALRAEQQHSPLHYSVHLPADSLFHSFAPLTPIRPHLDVATDTILPPAPNGIPVSHPSDSIFLKTGMQLQSILKDSQRITLCGIRLLDSQGVVVASSGSESGLSLVNRIEVSQALQGYYASVLRKRISDEPIPRFTSFSRKGWLRVLVAMPVIHGQKVVGAVLISRSPISVGKGLYLIRKNLLLAGVIMLVLVILISWITTVLISRPLKKLVWKTREVHVHGGNLAPLTHPGTREVAELSEAISDMANTLRTRADYIRNFARHVSHEFKTPITSMQGSIELMQDMAEEMSSEERAHFLKNMDQDVHYLGKLTHGLMELARADMSSPDHSRCNPAKVLDALLTHYKRNGRHIQLQVPAKPTSVAMKSEIFRSIISNLVENSFQHGKATVVDITIQHNQQHNQQHILTIAVTDNGTGIADANTSKIFTPFFTTARNKGGTGLGLAVTQALIEGHGGELRLCRSSPHGTQFEIRLP